MPRYLLDTNICIYIKNHRPAEVLARFAKLPPGKVAMSAITYGELCFGAERSSKSKESHSILEQLITLIPVLPLDETASVHYGKIRQHLQVSGKPIGNNDLWIASHALANKLILVTNNVAEFERVPGLRVENWVGR
ncbi:MAG: type II toxin-antitoxin system VapC family toxin [Gammaproteobacteria bacterium]|nr:type II toxin-antitoxin system VapC family toxin [Gammaproteobacteria bacterium]MBU1775848.1 type II toxin-antitoxin system VapC family toxin [Gammaproteobacteria bacterium]MBU1969926.1 type II toxin-antitoxin system VapC family toxin [Gammaproteobacteria bacterium]